MKTDKTLTVNEQISNFINSLTNLEIKNSPFISFITETDEINFYSALKYFHQRSDNIFYYSVPQRNFYIAASGEAFKLEFDSTDQLNKYSVKFDGIKNSICNNFISCEFNPPLFFLSAKFPSERISGEWKDFNNTKLFTPEFIFIKSELKVYLVINYKSGSASGKKRISEELYKTFLNLQQIQKNFQDKGITASLTKQAGIEYDDWAKKVYSALNRIENNEIDKVVISRTKVFKIEGEIEPEEIAFILDKQYSECYNFIYKSGASVFFSASPEKLFSLNNFELQTEALAGSIERGNNSDEDKSFESFLFQSSKDIDEHNFVIDHLNVVLEKYCNNILTDKSPSLKKLSNIQHLHSRLSGKVKDNFNIFSMIKDIFPTPAVGGYPAKSAIKVIDELEDFDRGLFTGFVGWMNLNNDAEFIVAIRSGLINKNKLYVYAGCGIVSGSDPIKEFEETELKSEAIISIFKNENKN